MEKCNAATDIFKDLDDDLLQYTIDTQKERGKRVITFRSTEGVHSTITIELRDDFVLVDSLIVKSRRSELLSIMIAYVACTYFNSHTEIVIDPLTTNIRDKEIYKKLGFVYVDKYYTAAPPTIMDMYKINFLVRLVDRLIKTYGSSTCAEIVKFRCLSSNGGGRKESEGGEKARCGCGAWKEEKARCGCGKW